MQAHASKLSAPPARYLEPRTHPPAHQLINPYIYEQVNLWRVSSISSAPLLELEGDETSDADTGDGAIRCIDEHEESVYAVAWSACDAWVFASLSYDGRVVINHVPSTEKYKILL